jgi:hypothetical protein
MRHNRHTYATFMLRAGVSFPGIMKLLGHSSPDMTMRYLGIACLTCNANISRPVPNLDTSYPNRSNQTPDVPICQG